MKYSIGITFVGACCSPCFGVWLPCRSKDTEEFASRFADKELLLKRLGTLPGMVEVLGNGDGHGDESGCGCGHGGSNGDGQGARDSCGNGDWGCG